MGSKHTAVHRYAAAGKFDLRLSRPQFGVRSEAEDPRQRRVALASNLPLPCGLSPSNGRHVRPRCDSVVTDRRFRRLSTVPAQGKAQ